MATSRAKFDKRRKEVARQERQKEKRARREAAKTREPGADPEAAEEDPDIAGIQLGPQPPQEDEPVEEE